MPTKLVPDQEAGNHKHRPSNRQASWLATISPYNFTQHNPALVLQVYCTTEKYVYIYILHWNENLQFEAADEVFVPEKLWPSRSSSTKPPDLQPNSAYTYVLPKQLRPKDQEKAVLRSTTPQYQIIRVNLLAGTTDRQASKQTPHTIQWQALVYIALGMKNTISWSPTMQVNRLTCFWNLLGRSVGRLVGSPLDHYSHLQLCSEGLRRSLAQKQYMLLYNDAGDSRIMRRRLMEEEALRSLAQQLMD